MSKQCKDAYNAIGFRTASLGFLHLHGAQTLGKKNLD